MADHQSEENEDDIESLMLFEAERDDGEVEYKRLLLGKSEDRMLELETQMRYRIAQGDGQCVYLIEVDDDGTPYGLTESEYQGTHSCLEKIARRNDFSLRLLTKSKCKTERSVTEPVYIYEYVVRENNIIDYEEVKIGVAGNVDSAKSTTVGVLTSGKHDDGRGSARMKVLNFRHEVSSGRSSSVSQQILGYDPEGEVVNHDDTSCRKISWPEITQRSSKIISFFDLCGHTKYAKTTLTGMMGSNVDYAFITIGANMGVRGNTIEHISICLSLKIPVVILLTKIDVCENRKEVLAETLSDIKRRFTKSGMRKMVYEVKDIGDVITVSKNITKGDIVPIFQISNITGVGIDLVHEFLNLIRPRLKYDQTEPAMLSVKDTFQPKGVGTVLGGTLKKGLMEVDKEYYLGPFSDSTWKKIKVRSMHVKKTLVQQATPGRYVCVGVPHVKRHQVHRGMVIMKHPGISSREFYAEIIVHQTHHTTIRIGWETSMHSSYLRETVKLIDIIDKKRVKLKKSNETIPVDETTKECLSLGDRALVKFRFKYRPCFVEVNDRLLLAEEKVKVAGRICRLIN